MNSQTVNQNRNPLRGHLPRLIVTVCTYQRNEQLERLLTELLHVAGESQHLCRVGVVVVDDNPDRSAQPLAHAMSGRFELDIAYAVSGERNISRARNIGLEEAIQRGDWIVMTDDDCVPDRRWLSELLACQQRTNADAVSGLMVRRPPPDAPRWIIEHGLGEGISTYPVDTKVSMLSTHNSMISAAWLRNHPDVRFDADYGRLGGEDVVFSQTAHSRGLHIRYTPEAVVYEDAPPERLTLRFLVRQAMWLGNSGFLTKVRGRHASRSRMALHGCAQIGRGVFNPFVRLLRGEPPAFRYGLTQAATGVGTLLGLCGVRLRHH